MFCMIIIHYYSFYLIYFCVMSAFNFISIVKNHCNILNIQIKNNFLIYNNFDDFMNLIFLKHEYKKMSLSLIVFDLLSNFINIFIVFYYYINKNIFYFL